MLTPEVWLRLQDNTPLQYSWVGYDVLLGSHFDEYIISYNEFIPGTHAGVSSS
jgi:hypothetical protein